MAQLDDTEGDAQRMFGCFWNSKTESERNSEKKCVEKKIICSKIWAFWVIKILALQKQKHLKAKGSTIFKAGDVFSSYKNLKDCIYLRHLLVVPQRHWLQLQMLLSFFVFYTLYTFSDIYQMFCARIYISHLQVLCISNSNPQMYATTAYVQIQDPPFARIHVTPSRM